MIPFIITERCAAQPNICPPLKDCPNNALFYVEDTAIPIGGRIEINPEKCDGCGKCVEVCCGHCIEMR